MLVETQMSATLNEEAGSVSGNMPSWSTEFQLVYKRFFSTYILQKIYFNVHLQTDSDLNNQRGGGYYNNHNILCIERLQY